MDTYTTSEFADLVNEEISKAREAHGDQTSYHEGLAIIMEEFEELKAEVFRKNVDKDALKKELIQTATMCRRFYEDLLEENK